MNRFENYSDVKNYWSNLFPEMKNISDLNDLIWDTSKKKIDDFEFQAGTTDDQKNLIDLILKKYNKELSEGQLVSRIYTEKFHTVHYYYFYEPILNFYFDDFYERLGKFDFIKDMTTFVEVLTFNLLNLLGKIGIRTSILEVNIAKMSQLLEGETGEECFLYYNKNLLRNFEYIAELYTTYPTLIELLCSKTQQFYNYILEIMMSIDNDWNDIASEFQAYDPKKSVKMIMSGLGDEHKNGKTVTKVVFDEAFSLIYKPRNLLIEKGFNQLVDWINDENIKDYLALKTIGIISKKDHGWVEYVEYSECKDIEEVKAFYTRMGELLFLLYSLDAVDFHHENLIALGEHPVLIDLETLFHPRIKKYERFSSESRKMAQKQIEESVLSVGFLPYFLVSKGDLDNRIDISGLGGEAEQVSPFKSLKIINEKSDDIRIVWENDKLQPQKNNPKLNGQAIHSDKFTDEILSGFSSIYDWVINNKGIYKKRVKELFSSAESRMILKPTRQYAQLLRVSYHPDFLRDYIHRFILLHRVAIYVPENLKPLLASELNSLVKGEVPYFTCFANGRHVYNSEGACFKDMLPQIPIKVIENKIAKLDYKDYVFQRKLINMSYQIKTSGYEKDATRTVLKNDIDKAPGITRQKWLDTAVEIGEYIVDNSIVGNDETKNRTWVSSSLDAVNETSVTITPVGDDLYNGNSGMALFLAYLGLITRDERFKSAAKEAMYSSMRFIEQEHKDQKYSIGAFNGISGNLYTLHKLYMLQPDEELRQYCIKYLETINTQIENDRAFDVIGGSTGCLAVMLSVYEESRDEDIRKLAIENANLCFMHLYNNRISIPAGGIAWGDDKLLVPSSGFAHGNSGIIAFLAKLMSITQNNEINRAIKEALIFERGLFSEKHQNWFMNVKKEKLAFGWCHGAPGILLSKVLLKTYCPDIESSKIDEELDIAFKTTTQSCFGLNPSFCHGDLGHLDILLVFSKLSKNKELEMSSQATFQDFYENVILKRWKEGVLRGTESMGLMNGLSGFGYSLLRFYEPQIVPSILMLQ